MLILSHTIRKAHMNRDSHISPAEFGLDNKYKEINFAHMLENRISGNGDRFNQNDFAIDTRGSPKNCQDLSEPSQESFYNSSGIDQVIGLLSSTIQAVQPFENGWNKERTYDQIEQRDLSLSSKSQYVYHSRIPAFSIEYSSRQGIKKKQTLQSGFFIPKFFKRFLDY